MKFCCWTHPNPSELSWVQFISKTSRHVPGYLVPDVSRKSSGFIFKNRNGQEKFLHVSGVHYSWKWDLELSPNVSNGITNDENSHPNRTKTSSVPLRKLKNSHNWFRFGVSLHVPVTFDSILPRTILLKSLTIKIHASRLMTFIWKYVVLHSTEEILKSVILDTVIILFLRDSRRCHSLTQHNIVFYCYN